MTRWWTTAKGTTPHVPPPVFRRSERKALVRVADMMDYVCPRVLADERAGRPSKPQIAHWVETYVRPRLRPVPVEDETDVARHRALLAEYVVMNAGGPLGLRRTLARQLRSVLDGG